jgi:acetyl esterase/lipase
LSNRMTDAAGQASRKACRMPIGYLITTSLVACGVLSALAPPRRPFILGVLSFVVGFALNELPFIAAAWLVASTLLALDQTGLGSPVGVAAAVVAVLAMAGLLLVVRRALLTGPALERALTDGLGAGWRRGVGDAGSGRRIMSVRVLFAPLWMRRRDVTRIANLSYGDAGRKNLLDVYHGRPGTAKKPVLIHLHGGVLFMGRKNRESLPLLYRLASQGWVCISANYRLRPAVTFPDHLIDAKKVIAWAREHARDYGADPSVVLVAGSSSGGQLAALAALTSNDPRYQPGFEHADTSVNAAICLHGYYGQPGSGETDPFSPLAYSGAGAPPLFIAHGDRDSLIPVETARLFAERMRAGSASPVVYAELPGAQHGFDRFHSIRFEQVVDAVEAFAAWVRLREPQRPNR